VASAGNGTQGGNCGSPTSVTYPSGYDNVISVSSVSGNLCCETTFNPWGPSFNPPLHHNYNNTVDVLAQGYAVVTGNCSGGGQSLGFGTSISGPHVAGIIGLMLSVNPCLTHDDVLGILQSTGQDVTGVCNNSTYYPGGAPPVPCAEAAVLAAENFVGPDIIIDEDTVWDKKLVSGNVIIKGGYSLTIIGRVSLATNSKIIVEREAELIIDEGILTACDQEWKGVVIEGYSIGEIQNQDLAGKVTMRNSALIELARTGISTNPVHLGWPTVTEHYGGLIEATDSEISNCNRAVEFMKYGTGFIEDQSFFKNCDIIDISGNGVTIWANNNVTFEDCLFASIAESGILAYDSEVIVKDNCRFINQPIGIDILTTFPIPFGSKIGSSSLPKNFFSCHNYGIFAQTQGNIEAMTIENNFFTGSDYGIHINGFSHFDINNNVLSSHNIGSECVSTGDLTHSNFIRSNQFGSNGFGAHAAFDNSNLEYLENCFTSTSSTDIFVNSGAIFIEQGSEIRANGNCFTKNNIPEIDNSQNTLIKLWVWDNEPVQSCKFPTVVFNDPNYNVFVDLGSLQNSGNLCGESDNPDDPQNPEEPTNFPCGIGLDSRNDISEKITEVESIISELEINSEIEADYRMEQIRIFSRCLNDLQNRFVEFILEDELLEENEKIENAISYLSAIDKFEKRIYAFGLMVNTNQFNRARDFINSLSPEKKPYKDFIIAQNINLDFLENVENYILSPTDKEKLISIGMGNSPLDGYSRSIYEVITGERLELYFPEPKERLFSGERAFLGGENNEGKIEVFPNPILDSELSILLEDFEHEEKLTVKLTNLQGFEIYKSEIDKNEYKINTSNFIGGVYILQISNDKNEIKHIEKLIFLD